ncbi:MAG: hypothetical protein ACYDG6_04260 [Thermincolia bacterium]
MESLAQLGLLYVYLMLVILVVALGYALFQGIKKLAVWAGTKDTRTRTNEQPWIRLAFFSGVILFISIFSLGVLKTIGVGGDSQNHHAQTPVGQVRR